VPHWHPAVGLGQQQSRARGYSILPVPASQEITDVFQGIMEKQMAEFSGARSAAAPGDDLDQGNYAGDMAAMISRLSPREREVAELVAQGLSDREISSRLVISRRTVESHVAHIFTKLGLSSRVRLATYMVRLS